MAYVMLEQSSFSSKGQQNWRIRGVLRLPSLWVAAAFFLQLPSVVAYAAPSTPFHLPYDEITEFVELNPSAVASVRHFQGATRRGDPMKAIVISDNPEVHGDEPVIFIVGVIHGREVLGARAVLALVETLTEGYGVDPDVTSWVDAYQVWVVPVLNPFGYENQLRKNEFDTSDPATSGVDLNRNAAFRWDRCDNSGRGAACLDPASTLFRGPTPFSEPETSWLRDRVESLRPVFGVTFHAGEGGSIGALYYPWSIRDHGDDDVAGTCDDLIVRDPVNKQRGLEVARVLREGIWGSRVNGRFCDGSSGISGACGRPVWGGFGSAANVNAYHHAATGMYDFLIETDGDLNANGSYSRSEAFRDDYFYATNPILSASQQSHYDDAAEYVRNYHDGLVTLLDYFLCDYSSGAFQYQGPGITGRSLNHDGDPVSAVVRVLGLDTTLDADFMDLDCDGVADLPYGEPDLQDRTSNESHGRFFRLLDEGSYTIEFSAPGLPTVTRSVKVGPGCLEEFSAVLQSPPVASAGSDQWLEETMRDGAVVSFDGSSSSDPDSRVGNDGIALFEWFADYGRAAEMLLATGETATSVLPLGSHLLTLRVTDHWGESDTDQVVVTVARADQPDVSWDAGVSLDAGPEGLHSDGGRCEPRDPTARGSFTESSAGCTVGRGGRGAPLSPVLLLLSWLVSVCHHRCKARRESLPSPPKW